MLTSVVQSIHNSPREQRDAGSRFRRSIASSIPAPRNVLPTSPTKQTIAAKSNRERIGFFSYDSSGHLSVIEIQSEISNRNSRLLEIQLNPAETLLTYFLTATKPSIPVFPSVHYCVADGLPMLPVSSQETVRQPLKSVRIQREMAVSPQTLGAQSTTAQDFIDSVNPATGDVWQVVVCRPATSRTLRMMQESIRKRFHYKPDEYRRLKARKPAC